MRYRFEPAAAFPGRACVTVRFRPGFAGTVSRLASRPGKPRAYRWSCFLVGGPRPNGCRYGRAASLAEAFAALRVATGLPPRGRNQARGPAPRKEANGGIPLFWAEALGRYVTVPENS